MPVQHRTIDLEEMGPVTSRVADRAAAGSPAILTRGGLPVAAIVSVESLLALERDRDLLRRLALGELESAAGEGEELAAVLEDCRLLLKES